MRGYPTHLLKIYYENPTKPVLFEIEQEKLPEEIERSRQRGGMFGLKNKRVMNVKEIKLA